MTRRHALGEKGQVGGRTRPHGWGGVCRLLQAQDWMLSAQLWVPGESFQVKILHLRWGGRLGGGRPRLPGWGWNVGAQSLAASQAGLLPRPPPEWPPGEQPSSPAGKLTQLLSCKRDAGVTCKGHSLGILGSRLHIPLCVCLQLFQECKTLPAYRVHQDAWWIKAGHSLPICTGRVPQSCLTLCDPTDCSPPGSSLSMGIFQARTLEWVAMPSCRGSSQPRDGAQISCTAG